MKTKHIVMRIKWHIMATPIFVVDYVRNEMVKDNKHQEDNNWMIPWTDLPEYIKMSS